MSDHRPAHTSRVALPADAGRVCPYCRFALKQGGGVVECGGCRAPHHEDCWGDNGGCAVMGCVGAPGPDQTAPVPGGPLQQAFPAANPWGPQPAQSTAEQPYGSLPAPASSGSTQSGRRASPVLIGAVLALALAIAIGAAALVLTKRDSSANSRPPVAADDNAPPPAPTDTSTDSSDTTTSTPTTSGAVPDESEDQMASDIQRVLLGHHRAIVQGNYRTAWVLTSERYRNKKLRESGGYAAWVAAQRSLTPYLDPDGTSVSMRELSRATGVATVDVTGMGWDKPGSSCTSWSGVTWAKYERGHWRYEPGYSISHQRRAEWKPRRSELLGWDC